MHELRNIIHRLRQGDTSREIARTQRVSRDTVAKVRNHALEAGWLDKQAPLPFISSSSVPRATKKAVSESG